MEATPLEQVVVLADPWKCTAEVSTWPFAGLLTVTLAHAVAGSTESARSAHDRFFMDLPRMKFVFAVKHRTMASSAEFLKTFFADRALSRKSQRTLNPAGITRIQAYLIRSLHGILEDKALPSLCCD
jgi:hypothetical protein